MSKFDQISAATTFALTSKGAAAIAADANAGIEKIAHTLLRDRHAARIVSEDAIGVSERFDMDRKAFREQISVDLEISADNAGFTLRPEFREALAELIIAANPYWGPDVRGKARALWNTLR